jgi:hypothetical protein
VNALEAAERLLELDKQIEALGIAYGRLYDDFDYRIYGIRLGPLKTKLEEEREALDAKLRAVQL